jgi:hypothetical protein
MARLTLETFPEGGLAPPRQPDAPPRRRAVSVSGAEPEVLPGVLRPEVNLAVWHRTLPEALTAGLRPMTDAAPFTAVVEDDPERAVDALAAKLPAAAPLDLLLDIHRLALAFAAVADTCGAVRIRIEAITGPACHRWHADAVGLRLLCTYRGPGTEWLPLAGGAAVARSLDPKALPCERSRIATGAAAILKGEGFPGNAGFGCIHRSPPAGPGERARLLLCLDEPGRIPLE